MKAEFVTELRVARTPGTDFWRLLEPFVVKVDGEKIVVPPNFQTDFASVPRLPLAFLLFGGKADCSATVHDYLYSVADRPRQVCDEIFLVLMEAEGLSEPVRKAMYDAVRIGGHDHYGKKGL